MGNATNIKRKNVTDILTILYTEKATTKNSIAKKLDLSAVTVHNIINELTDMGICIESGERISSGGRNAVVYKINEKYGYIIGQNIDRTKIETRIYDIALNMLYESSVPCILNNVDSCISIATSEISAALSCGLPEAPFLGIGITVPGRANGKGTVINIPGYPEWRNIPLSNYISETVGTELPVVIDNDNNAAALSTKWGGIAYRFQNYVYVSTVKGVGVGVVLDNSIFYGSSRNASEIGHISIMPEGPVCRCGGRGCIEAFASDDAIYAKVSSKISGTYGISVNSWSDIKSLCDSSEYPLIQGYLSECAKYIVMTIKTVIKVFDPDAVIIRSEWLPYFGQIWTDIVSAVFADCTWLRRDKFSLLLNRCENTLKAGPACLIMERLYASSDKTGLFKLI